MSVDDADKQAANPNFEREYILDVNGRFTDGVSRESTTPPPSANIPCTSSCFCNERTAELNLCAGYSAGNTP